LAYLVDVITLAGDLLFRAKPREPFVRFDRFEKLKVNQGQLTCQLER
jgi:hypothetical protein